VVVNRELVPYSEQLTHLGLRVVVNEHAERGMGSSIACGVLASQDAPGWLIALADMPYIKTETIARLADKLGNSTGIVAPLLDQQGHQQRGHPVGFSRRYKDELLALEDDVGARDVIADHASELELVPTEDAGVTVDVDEAVDIINEGSH